MSSAISSRYAINLADVSNAAQRIKELAVVTPVVKLKLNKRSKNEGKDETEEEDIVYLKCEGLQRGGSFKFRGACNSVIALQEERRASGASGKLSVVTHSSGNHAAALALAASLNGADAHVVMPDTAPECKKNAAIANGAASLTLCASTMEAREAAAATVMSSTGAILIPPYNFSLVMAGQGTIALELLEQVENLDCIIVPVSGAGMISGISIAAKTMNPKIKIIAAEPLGNNNAADIFESVRKGVMVEDMQPPDTIADGLRARMGTFTWPVVKDMVDKVVVVSEEEIQESMKIIWQDAKVICEPSGAVALAGYRSSMFKEWLKKEDIQISKTALIVSGANLDLENKWQYLL